MVLQMLCMLSGSSRSECRVFAIMSCESMQWPTHNKQTDFSINISCIRTNYSIEWSTNHQRRIWWAEMSNILCQWVSRTILVILGIIKKLTQLQPGGLEPTLNKDNRPLRQYFGLESSRICSPTYENICGYVFVGQKSLETTKQRQKAISLCVFNTYLQ